MSEILVLSKNDLAQVLTLEHAIAGVEQAFHESSTLQSSQIPMLYHSFGETEDMDIKAGHMVKGGVYGLKLVSWFGHNPEKGLPAMLGTTMLFDDSTGRPLALLNAEGIGKLRTGAAGAIGAKYLANPDAKHLLVVGTGAQAACQIAATLLVMPGLQTVTVYNPHGAARAVKRLPEIESEVRALLAACGKALTLNLTVAVDLQAAVGESDIIITATPSTEPLIQADWVKPGTHFSCIGADVRGKQELDPVILKNARVFADDLQQAIAVGECQTAVGKGILFQTEIAGEIGALVDHSLLGRCAPEDVTVFDSTGIALQDLVVAKMAYDLATEQGIGTQVQL